MAAVSRFAQTDCVPADAFWNANRDIAELIWRRGDGATMSTRVAEDVHEATGVPTHKAKTNLHAFMAVGVGLGAAYLVTRAASDPGLKLLGFIGAIAAARKTYRYLQQDRCR